MDEETKKAVADAIAEATKALKDKNAELIGEVRSLKTAKQEAESAAEEAAAEAASKSGDVEAVKAQLEKKHKTELEKLTKQVDALTADAATYKIDSVISKAIADNGVMPGMIPFVEAYLKTGAKLENGEAIKDGMPFNDAVSAFFTSEAAKGVIAAPVNSGGGATGSTTSASTHGYTKETLTLTAFSQLAKEDPAKANTIAASVGSNFKV